MTDVIDHIEFMKIAISGMLRAKDAEKKSREYVGWFLDEVKQRDGEVDPVLEILASHIGGMDRVVEAQGILTHVDRVNELLNSDRKLRRSVKRNPMKGQLIRAVALAKFIHELTNSREEKKEDN